MSAPKSFLIYEKRHASGNVGFRLDFGPVNGKRVFKSFSAREKAEAAQKELETEHAGKNPLLLAGIDVSTRNEILHAVESNIGMFIPSFATLKQALAIVEQNEILEAYLSRMTGGDSSVASGPEPGAKAVSTRDKSKMSPKTMAKMRAFQQAR